MTSLSIHVNAHATLGIKSEQSNSKQKCVLAENTVDLTQEKHATELEDNLKQITLAERKGEEGKEAEEGT